MAGTIIANSVQPDLGTNLYLDATQGNGKVIIGNTTTTLMSFDGTGKASSVSANNGLYSSNNFTGTFTDGIVVDYVTGNGRISVGTADALTIYNGGVASSALMTLDSSGNMGLGVTPSGWSAAGGMFPAFEIGGYGSAIASWGSNRNLYATSNAYYNSGFIYKTTGGAAYYNVSGETSSHKWFTAPSGTAGAAISFTQAMTLDASGNLGVGTTSPAAKLDLAGALANTGILQRLTANASGGNAKIQFGDIASYNWTCGTTGNAFTWSTSEYSTTTGTERMRIDSSGNLLVGTTSFTNSNNKGLAVWFSSATNSGGEGGIELRNTSTSTNSDTNPTLLIFKNSGTTTSAQRFIQFYATVTQPMGGIVGNGATNVQFVSLSDAREKTNINPIAGSLAKILTLKPSSFDWVATGEHINAGFVAQDVLEVFPEFVVDNISNAGQEQRYGLTGGMTGGIIPHLVKAIQELSAELNELKAKVNA